MTQTGLKIGRPVAVCRKERLCRWRILKPSSPANNDFVAIYLECSPCLNYLQPFRTTFGDWLTALGQHLQLSLLTLLLAVFWLSHRLFKYVREPANWVSQVAGIFQTIPSMAVLTSSFPLWALGRFPALTLVIMSPSFKCHHRFARGLNQVEAGG